MASTDDISGKLKSSSDLVMSRQDKQVDKSDKNGLSDIEQLVQGKKFSMYISLICYNFFILFFFFEKGMQSIRIKYKIPTMLAPIPYPSSTAYLNLLIFSLP